MIITRIVQLADGEELISYEGGEGQRTSLWKDDPRRAALERRGLLSVTQVRRDPRAVRAPAVD